MNKQKKLCAEILSMGADYCMAVKRNHARLYDEIAGWFKTTKAAETAKTQERVDKEHGRFEERAVWCCPQAL